MEQGVGIVIALIALFGSVITAVLGANQASKASKAVKETARSVNEAELIKLGVSDLITQYQTRNTELVEEVRECTGKCREFEASLESLETEVSHLRRALVEREEEIVFLKQKIESSS